MDPEFRSLVGQGFKLLPDPEHECNIQFFHYAAEAIWEGISKWRGGERRSMNERMCAPRDLAKTTEAAYWHLLNKIDTGQHVGLVNALTLFQLHAAQANDRCENKVLAENKRATNTHTQAHCSAFLSLVLSLQISRTDGLCTATRRGLCGHKATPRLILYV